jgi:glycosyltransferase involved in cell wall biosynthesis
LGQAINSALLQTYPDVEIIVVDDGSSDRTEEFVMRRYGDQVRFFRKTQGGTASARNVALRASAGEFIALLDADDLWIPNRLSIMVEALKAAPECSACRSLWRNFWDDPALEAEERARCSGFVGVRRDMILTATVLRRSAFQAVGLFDERYMHTSEEDWWIRLHDRGGTVWMVEQVLFLRRIHARNKSRGKLVEQERLQVLMERHRRLRSRPAPASS